MASQTQDEIDVQEDLGREPLPAGHPLAWGALVEGTILDGLAWPGWADTELGHETQAPVAAGDAMSKASGPALPADGDAMAAARYVVARLEEAGHTLLCLPNTGYSTRLRSSALEVVRAACEMAEAPAGKRLRVPVPSAARIGEMDQAWSWLGLIPADRYVLRRIVGARALVAPTTERHLFSWRRLGGLLGADHRAVQRWHAEGVGWIVMGLASAATAA